MTEHGQSLNKERSISVTLADLPSVDRLLQSDAGRRLSEQFGHDETVAAFRAEIATLRERLQAGEPISDPQTSILAQSQGALHALFQPSLKSVLNLTGTVLHTNLGRAPLPAVALEAIAKVSEGASNLEFDLATGRRGDRDSHVEHWICRLTGAEAATVVNNNAAAVLLILNALALRKEVLVSRGELVEIGGAFRVPDIMARAGAKLHEVGTTNRTHAKDFSAGLSDKAAMIMKVHASNYAIEGFTKTVPEAELAAIAHKENKIFAVDLGAGALVDLSEFGLPKEPTVSETLAAGADLVSFSGDKLLGGPQAGIIAGRADLIAKIKKNPLKRALRVDKMTLAALSALLPLYAKPERLADSVPALRLLCRDPEAIAETGHIVAAALAPRLQQHFGVSLIDCASQIGSGAQPVELLASTAIAIRPLQERGAGGRLKRLAAAFRGLPVPIIGRIHHGALMFDMRCLEHSGDLLDQLPLLSVD